MPTIVGAQGTSPISDAEVEVLLAERAITRALHDACRAVNLLDAELFAAQWHGGGLLDSELPTLHGTVADVGGDYLDWFAVQGGHFVQISNVIIEVAGDVAVSESYLIDVVRDPGTPEAGVRDYHRRGRNLDRWSKRGGAWRLDERRVLRSFDWKQDVGVGRPSPVAALKGR